MLLLHSAHRFLCAWCRLFSEAYTKWDRRLFTNGDGI
jgi:hypothetical protein